VLARGIVSLDLPTHQSVDNSGETYAYARLLLATGGRPRRLAFGGAEVIYYRTLDDYRRLCALADGGARLFVVGGGFIGSEIAAARTMNAVLGVDGVFRAGDRADLPARPVRVRHRLLSRQGDRGSPARR
jgi:NAD(P)H-nitrite reductase large subunit